MSLKIIWNWSDGKSFFLQKLIFEMGKVFNKINFVIS
jgi:hypothetical protein